MKLDHTIPFTDLKDAYIRAVAGQDVCHFKKNNDHVAEMVQAWREKSSFYGPSSKEVIEWLHKGYQQPGLTLDPPIEPVRKRRRLKYGEEGELQLDLMWSGHDYPFLDWTKRDTLPGMRVDIRTNFVSSTPVDIPIAFYRWVLRALVALESAGIDVEVWLTGENQGIFQGDSGNYLMNHVQVKKQGEQTDLLSWSPMLSPGGYRHLTFLSYIIGSDSHKKIAKSSLGHGPAARLGWTVSFDPDTSELRFACPYSPRDFPESEMDTQLRLVLAEARKAVA